MKRSQVVAVSVLTLMLLAVVPVQQAGASSAYSEKLNVFIAGSSAYWYYTFDGVNGSSKLTPFEGSPGLSWYNVTAIRATTWQSDFQIFGPNGYNLLPVPFVPSQGLFLRLGSDSYSDALAAVGHLDAYLMSSFVSLSNGSGFFEFYSPVSFDSIVPSTLLTLVPSSIKGFGAAIATSSFDGTLSPFVILEGTKGSPGFSHSLVVGSISSKALDTQNRPNLFTYSGKNITSLAAANQSSSSTIQVRVLDGVLSSKDNAVVVNDTSHFAGSYTLSVAALKKVYVINATVLQQPLQLLAARYVDVGVLRKNDNVSVTISLTNPSSNTAIKNVTFTDNWWNQSVFRLTSYPPSLFRLVGSSLTYTLPILNASQNTTPTYVLQYVGNATKWATIPSEAVQFAYTVGKSTFKGRSWLNPINISLGNDDPVVYAYVTPTESFLQPVGVNQSLSLVVKNVGTWPALSVVVDGQQKGPLSPGGTMTVKISHSATELQTATGNVTKKYIVTYADKNGNSFSTTTNLLPLEFTHSGMMLGFAKVTVGANLAPLKAGSTTINLTLSFNVVNAGSANISRFIAQLPVPPGLGCGVTNGTGIKCASNLLSLNYSSLAAKATESTSMKVNVTDLSNYFIPPISFRGTTAGINFTGKSNAFAVPTGYVLTKQFSPSMLFSGANSTVTLSAVNKGPFYVYKVNITSQVDTFDHLSPLAVPSVTNGSIVPGGNLSRSYIVTASTVYGNHTSSAITSNVFFGGTMFSLESLGPYVSVYQPLNLIITTTPSVPTEGKNFNIVLTIHNPAAVNVSSVHLTLPVPSGLTLSQLNNSVVSNGVLTVSIPLLSPHSDYKATGVAVASSGTTMTFNKASLTFVYEGATIKGTTPKQGILVEVNATSRYLIPIAIVVVALLATVFYVRRMAGSTVPASPK